MAIRHLILAALIALLSSPSLAAWACLPTPPMPLVSRTDMARVIKEPAGNYVVSWWCDVTVAGGSPRIRVEQLIVLGKYVDLPKFGAATARVMAAQDSLAAAIAELDAAKVNPAPGSQEMYDAMRLQRLGCLGLVQSTPPTMFLAPLPADFCGAEPVPPPPPTVQYVVTGLVAYPLTATGTKSNTPWPTPPIAGEPCDASVFVTSFNIKFYRVPRLSTTQTVVAGCGVKK